MLQYENTPFTVLILPFIFIFQVRDTNFSCSHPWLNLRHEKQNISTIVEMIYSCKTISLPHSVIYLGRLNFANFMMTSSNGNIFCVTGHLFGEFTGHRWILAQRPVTRSFDVFCDLRLNKRLSKQSWCWWFGTQSRPLWRHCNVLKHTLFNKRNPFVCVFLWIQNLMF